LLGWVEGREVGAGVGEERGCVRWGGVGGQQAQVGVPMQLEREGAVPCPQELCILLRPSEGGADVAGRERREDGMQFLEVGARFGREDEARLGLQDGGQFRAQIRRRD